MTSLLHDELGVVQHEGTEDEEAQVQVHVEEHGRSQEEVAEGQDQQPGQGRHQETAHVEEGAVVVEESGHGEADEDDRGAQQSCRNDAGFNGDGKVQQRTKRHT
eukprot:GHVL01033721.1.p2 GENE.GHVL01033721.1~~GHVL01033721.1.p2  ORF type:complete len:104 (+),score=25.02 GHVL01033721.1:1323-1634(+)